MNTDLDNATSRVLAKLHQEFPIPPEKEFQGWFEPPLNVLDCVLSLNRSYDRFCLPRVEKFRQVHPEITTLASLLELIESYPTPLDFSERELNYRDERRASTLVGVLKALLQAQTVFKDSEETSRLEAWAHAANPTDYENFGVRGFGLSGFQYLRMLFGAQTLKPDMHICRFVSDAVGRRVGDVEALALMEAAGRQLGWPLSRLDYAVWDRGARGSNALRDKSFISEVVLEVGAEGGSLTLVRETVWRFRMKQNEAAIYDLLSENDRSEAGNYSGQSVSVSSFQEALDLLDKYPWFRLHPVHVHPEFLDEVLSEVRTRGGEQEETRWREWLKHS